MNVIRACGALVLLLLPIHLPDRMEARGPAPVEVGRILTGLVSPRSTLASLLDGALGRRGVHELVEAARPVYDLRRITTGSRYGVALGANGGVQGFSYGIDELRTLRVRRVAGALQADILTRSYDVRVARVDGVVSSSLFAAIEKAGELDQLALDLADVFAWDVDFNTEIQRGDTFRVSVEKLTLDGRLVRYGRILAAELRNGSRTLQALLFEGARGSGYYAPDGTPLRKAFLRSPLRFTRISSGYSSARFHPILLRNTAHLGIDYAAPLGTPVNASANGVVALAGAADGMGRTVRLRHANGFETLYGHLQAILVRPGQRVEQGTPIGTVGATGLATGPHLHYAMFRNGSYANPLRVQLPPAEPVPDEEKQAFLEARGDALRLLGDAPVMPSLAAAPLTPALERPSLVRRQ
jgi:murein DD-endopeptidase MepM/ murein hydrolase activator NlpD